MMTMERATCFRNHDLAQGVHGGLRAGLQHRPELGGNECLLPAVTAVRHATSDRHIIQLLAGRIASEEGLVEAVPGALRRWENAVPRTVHELVRALRFRAELAEKEWHVGVSLVVERSKVLHHVFEAVVIAASECGIVDISAPDHDRFRVFAVLVHVTERSQWASHLRLVVHCDAAGCAEVGLERGVVVHDSTAGFDNAADFVDITSVCHAERDDILKTTAGIAEGVPIVLSNITELKKRGRAIRAARLILTAIAPDSGIDAPPVRAARFGAQTIGVLSTTWQSKCDSGDAPSDECDIGRIMRRSSECVMSR